MAGNEDNKAGDSAPEASPNEYGMFHCTAERA
jgi:hypothetical protein